LCFKTFEHEILMEFSMDNLKCCQSLNFNCYVGLQIEKQMNSTADKVHALFLISLNLNLMKRFEVHKP